MSRPLDIFKNIAYLSFALLCCSGLILLWVNPKTNALLSRESTVDEPTEESTDRRPDLQEWTYDFATRIDTDDDDYPIVLLREGYKKLKELEDVAEFGWKFEIVNTLADEREVTVEYKLLDVDGFELGEGREIERVKGRAYSEVLGTLNMLASDIPRVYTSTWTVRAASRGPGGTRKNQDNRYARAGTILAENGAPIWVHKYLKYLFSRGPEPPKGEGKWSSIARAMKVEPDPDLDSLLVRVGIRLHWPPAWEQIRTHSEYSSLTDDEKNNVKNWLRLQLEFGGYDPSDSLYWLRDWPKNKDPFKD